MNDPFSAPPLAKSVLDLIGNTPLLELNQIRKNLKFDGRIIAKLELFNPGGSKKDRVALSMVRMAKANGKLADGQAVVEVTSGNTGTGLAIVCRALGHPFYAVMSAGNTRERAQMMRALGAEVVLVQQAPGSLAGQVTGQDMKMVKETAANLVRQLGAFFVDQFENPANPLAHETQTSEEIWQQTGGNFDAMVGFVGSGGALGGLARGLRKKKPDLRVYVVEPAAASSLASGCCSDAGHAIQGGGYGREKLTLMEGVTINGLLTCTDEQASGCARMLALQEGILAGYSTGAQLHSCIELLAGNERGNTVLMMVCDTGMKYLSTGLYP